MKVWGVVRHFEHENILGIDEKLGRCTFSRNLSNTLKLIMYKEGFFGELLKVRTLQVRKPSLRFFLINCLQSPHSHLSFSLPKKIYNDEQPPTCNNFISCTFVSHDRTSKYPPHPHTPTRLSRLSLKGLPSLRWEFIKENTLLTKKATKKTIRKIRKI